MTLAEFFLFQLISGYKSAEPKRLRIFWYACVFATSLQCMQGFLIRDFEFGIQG